MNKKVFQFTQKSIIFLNTPQLWQEVTNMNGVNFELAPLVKMTLPKKFQNFTISDAPVNEYLFKSIILLFYFIPVDLHHFRLDKVVNNERFEEKSSSIMHYFWKHHRILTEVNDGTQIQDIIQFCPRFPFIGYLLKPIYQLVFNHRHKRLRKKFNNP